MGKKKKNKSRGWDDDFGWGRSVGNGNHRDRDKRWDRGPRLTLSKDAAKASAAIVKKPVKVPEEFTKNQAACNHAGGTLTVQEFLSECSTPDALVPMLQRLVRRFGADNVCVCERCFTPLVNPGAIDPAKVDEAIDYLYAGANAAVSCCEGIGGKEVKRLGAGTVSLYGTFGVVPSMLDDVSGGNGNGGRDDSSNLNSNPSGAF